MNAIIKISGKQYNVGKNTKLFVDKLKEKALIDENAELRGLMKKAGYLTRDSRVKERKKVGLKKARRSFQFSKR